MIAKRLEQGQILPAWYGVAWIEWDSGRAVCLPVGLNIVAGAARQAWNWVRHGWRPVRLDPREAYAQGVRDGRAQQRREVAR